MKSIDRSKSSSQVRARSDQVDFNLIFAFCFTVFLVTEIGQRLLPGYWMGGQQCANARKSIIAEALDSARTVVPYAFMG